MMVHSESDMIFSLHYASLPASLCSYHYIICPPKQMSNNRDELPKSVYLTVGIVHELCVFSVSINPMELQDQRAPCNNS